jgi:hypothetical protein
MRKHQKQTVGAVTAMDAAASVDAITLHPKHGETAPQNGKTTPLTERDAIPAARGR